MNEVKGKIKKYAIDNNKITLVYENNTVYIKIISSDIINFFIPWHRNERNSKAVEKELDNNVKFEVVEKEDRLQINTENLIVNIYDDFVVDILDSDGNMICEDYRGERAPFVRRTGDYKLAEAEGHKVAGDNGYKVYVAKKMQENAAFYGLGEQTGHLNKKGYHYLNWNTDNPAPHNETFDRLYKSIPFFIGMNDNKAFGIFFDNHFETHFDFGKDNADYYYFSAVDGNLDYYFINGPEISKVVEGYTSIVGRAPLPQLWTLGYQQCRWSYDTEERVMEIAENLRKREIPCDTIYLDIDYMDGYRVFTWNNERFKNPEAMIKKLKDMGFKLVTIIDPGVKVDENYEIYKKGIEKGCFAKDKDGNVYVNEVWPGDAVYPDFSNTKVRNWWADNQKIMMDAGVSGIWNDMNEPASFRGPLPDDVKFDNDGIEAEHKEIHNVYGHLMCKATYEGIKKATNKRPFIVTRACYAGSQKYTTVWTGDNQSTWEHLRMSVPMLMNLGLSGMSFCGTDVGGFGFDCTPELLSRWVQVGAFTPLFRNHSAMGTRDQEPWAFDKNTEEINRKYINLRYKFLPYFYDLMREAEKTGAPVIRPLVYNYQNDRKTYQINSQFMVGDSILVAPVLEQGVTRRIVYLPEGNNWFDYLTGQEYLGGQYIIKNAPLDVCPIFVRDGAIIPTYEPKQYVGEKADDKVKFLVYSSDETKYETKYVHYVDDGESFDYRDGKYNEYEVTLKNDNQIKLKVEKIHSGYEKEYSQIEVMLHSINGRDVIVEGGEKIIVEDDRKAKKY